MLLILTQAFAAKSYNPGSLSVTTAIKPLRVSLSEYPSNSAPLRTFQTS